MNKRLSIYLDTSVINFIYADDVPEKQEVTNEFFNNFISTGIYETWISEVVLAEILDTPSEQKRNDLLKVIDDYPIEIVDLNNQQLVEIEHLANLYVEQGVIPAKKRPDALHIAISTVCNINYLVSWNYRHLANVGKEQKIKMLNWQQNYLQELGIITPLELLNYES